MKSGRKRLLRPSSICHPDLPAYTSSGGFCLTCYKREWARNKRKNNPKPYKERKPIMARCHPDKRHWGKGFCIACYGKYYRRINPTVNKRATAKWRSQNKDKLYDKHLRYRYGLSLERYNQMFKEQNYSCKLCGLRPPNNPIVEHDHKTEKVRGIVCQRCNMAIAAYENYKDLAPMIIDYLEG